MKKNIQRLLAAVLILAACLIVYHDFAFAEGKYNSGEARITDAVESIDIRWVAGSVNVELHDADTVLLQETADREIKKEDQMRWRLEGKTLVVEFSKFRLFNFFTPKKALTVTLPRNLHLKNAKISATSADITVPEMTAEELRLESTSGDIRVSAAAEKVFCEATSGDMTLKINGKAKNVKTGSTSGNQTLILNETETAEMGSTSGKLTLAVEKAEKVRMGATSGTILLDAGQVGTADLGSTSGNIGVKAKAFEKISVGATSGDVTAELSAEPGFTARVDHTSGSFNNAIALSKHGNEWSCGNGSGQLKISTTSGDIQLKALE